MDFMKWVLIGLVAAVALFGVALFMPKRGRNRL
jgi:uncharacterized membrane protein